MNLELLDDVDALYGENTDRSERWKEVSSIRLDDQSRNLFHNKMPLPTTGNNVKKGRLCGIMKKKDFVNWMRSQ
ncbi:hypothetical protein ANTQUA_LOCUS1788 [Anthophora quadrimaculata]